MSAPGSTMAIDQGVFFPSAMRIPFVIVGVALSFVLIGLPILAMAIYRVGTEIDRERAQVREYGSLLGWRWGKWHDASRFRAIVILGKRRTGTMYSRGQVALDQVELNHDVNLVDATHRSKFLLKACDSLDEARSLSEAVAEYTDLPIERYAPQRIAERRR